MVSHVAGRFLTNWAIREQYVYLFIYLAASGLSCGARGLYCILWDLSLRSRTRLLWPVGLVAP